MEIQVKHKAGAIDVFESRQVNAWAMMLGISVETLLGAIAIVGNEVDAVEAYLRTRRIRRQHH
jgi:Protein of unknown function (DUF3606)